MDRPKSLLTLIAVLGTIGVFNLAAAFGIAELLGSDPLTNNEKVLYITMAILCAINCFLLFDLEKISFLFFPLSMVSLSTGIFFFSANGLNLLPLNYSLIMAGGFGFYILRKEIFTYYKNPDLRPWVSCKRHLKILPTELSVGSNRIKLQTFDLSESGVFLNANPNELIEITNFREEVELCINSGHHTLYAKAKPIRVALEPMGKYPPGIGLEFTKPQTEFMQQI